MSISITVNPRLTLKDPLSSEIGNRILREGLKLMNELGFEAFTFKKLAQDIGSTEATIYRYFENKHNLLLYLINWYWGIVEYRLKLATANISDSHARLLSAVRVLTTMPSQEDANAFPEEIHLKLLVIQDSGKAINTKAVDDDNQQGVYSIYKAIVAEVADIVRACKPEFPYPEMLVTMLIENANQHRFYSVHLPRLTNASVQQDSIEAFSQLIIQKVLL